MQDHFRALSGSVRRLTQLVLDRRWLLVVFAAAAVSLVLWGLQLHQNADPPDDAVQQNGGKVVDISVFSQQPKDKAVADLFVDAADGQPTYSIQLYPDDPAADYSVLVTSSILDRTNLFRPMSLNLADSVASVTSPKLYYFVDSSRTVHNDLGKAKFVLPTSSYLNERGTLTVRMPTIGLQDSAVSPFGETSLTMDTEGPQIVVQPVTLDASAPLGSLSPSDYMSSQAVHPKVVFLPTTDPSLKSTEFFQADRFNMAVAEVQANAPSDGTFSDGAYSWSGHYDLAPYLSLVEPDALARRSSDDFLSGILLATGAAALIAFFQELPESLGRSVRLTKIAPTRGKGPTNAPAHSSIDRRDHPRML